MGILEELGMMDNALFAEEVQNEFSYRRRGCKHGRTMRGTCRKRHY